MNYRKKNFGLPGILDGTTASEAELQNDARRAVMKKLGVASWAKPSMHPPADQDLDLYVEVPIKKEKPIVEVKDEHGFTPSQNRGIHKYITRPPDPYAAARKQQALLKKQQATKQQAFKYQSWADRKTERLKPMTEDQKEATDFWSAYNDPSGKKMVSHIDNMNMKYNSEEATQTKYDKPLAVIRQKMNENKNNKTVKQLTDLKNWANSSKKA